MLSKLRECANRDLTMVKFRKLSSNGCWSFDDTINSRVGGSCQPNSDSLKIQLSQEAANPSTGVEGRLQQCVIDCSPSRFRECGVEF
jgi:hypothetical protein